MRIRPRTIVLLAIALFAWVCLIRSYFGPLYTTLPHRFSPPNPKFVLMKDGRIDVGDWRYGMLTTTASFFFVWREDYRNGAVVAGTRYGMSLWPIAIVPTLGLVAIWIRHRRNAKTGCPTCGYDWHVTPGRCPECGHGQNHVPSAA